MAKLWSLGADSFGADEENPFRSSEVAELLTQSCRELAEGTMQTCVERCGTELSHLIRDDLVRPESEVVEAGETIYVKIVERIRQIGADVDAVCRDGGKKIDSHVGSSSHAWHRRPGYCEFKLDHLMNENLTKSIRKFRMMRPQRK